MGAGAGPGGPRAAERLDDGASSQKARQETRGRSPSPGRAGTPPPFSGIAGDPRPRAGGGDDSGWEREKGKAGRRNSAQVRKARKQAVEGTGRPAGGPQPGGNVSLSSGIHSVPRSPSPAKGTGGPTHRDRRAAVNLTIPSLRIAESSRHRFLSALPGLGKTTLARARNPRPLGARTGG